MVLDSEGNFYFPSFLIQINIGEIDLALGEFHCFGKIIAIGLVLQFLIRYDPGFPILKIHSDEFVAPLINISNLQVFGFSHP